MGPNWLRANTNAPRQQAYRGNSKGLNYNGAGLNPVSSTHQSTIKTISDYYTIEREKVRSGFRSLHLR